MKLDKINICFLLIILFSVGSLASPLMPFDQVVVFSSYGKESWKDEKQILDALTIELKNGKSKDIAYFYFYGGRQTCISEAKTRAEKAKNYLIRKQKISDKRIILREGGYRDNLTIEVYVEPKDVVLDAAAPTLSESEVQKKCRR